MYEQDKVFLDAYDKEYTIDLKKKKDGIMNKILEAIKGKGQMTTKE